MTVSNQHIPLRGRLYTVSNALARAGIYLPFAGVIALFFQKELLHLFDPLLFEDTAVSHFSVLRDQYAFLSRESVVGPPETGDFRVFEMFIWLASIVALLRVSTGICSPEVLRSFRGKVTRIQNRGLSTFAILSIPLLGGPFGIFCSLNFKFVSSSDQALLLMRHSPQLFVCLEVFTFCVSAIFIAEGFLSLVWLTFVRVRDDEHQQLV